ncbi:MAG: DUF2177 family protein [Acidimicrobiia bacterium]
MWIQFGISMVTFIVLDALWLGLLMADFYRRHLGHLARMADGRLDPIWPVAALVYPALAGGLTVLVVSKARSPIEALALGAFFGLVTYAVYDLTNHSTLRDWPAILTITDIAWGAVLCGTTAWITYTLAKPA